METNQNLSRLEGKKDNNVNCHHGVLNKGHAERVGGAPRTSASSTHAVMPLKQQRHAWKIPKANKQAPYNNTMGRAQAEKSAVWNDLMITTTRVGSRSGVNLTLPKEAQLYPRTLRAARRSGMTTWGKPSRMTNDASGFNHPSLVTPQGFYAGYSEGKRGFTLIELLVVVLIIGILAAVAVPQYQKAVLKAQSRNLLVLMENIRRAEEVYYLENNIYTTKWAELPIKIPSSEWNISLWENSVLSQPSKYPGVGVYFFFKNTSHIWAGKRECYARMNDNKANQFCQAMAGHTTPDTGNGPNTVNIYHIP